MRGRLWSSRTPTGTIQSGLSLPGRRHRPRERSMKKASRKPTDELRPEYKRSDFGRLARGKYAQLWIENDDVRRLGDERRRSRSRAVQGVPTTGGSDHLRPEEVAEAAVPLAAIHELVEGVLVAVGQQRASALVDR